MASAFWTLEDGRGFARNWHYASHTLELIVAELQTIEGASDFAKYLSEMIYRPDEGDTPNGFGGFIRGNEVIMINFDLRTFSPKNRRYFWRASQNVYSKIKLADNEKYKPIQFLLHRLLDMHKRITKKENPMLLNDMSIIVPAPN
jgi:hypothetical protein